MKFLDYINFAFKNISRQKTRTGLTVTAIVIGAMSVIIMLSLVIGARQIFIDQLKAMDALTMVTVTGSPDMQGNGNLLSSGNGPDNSGKKMDDKTVADFAAIDHVTGATPALSIWAKSMKLEGQDKKTWPDTLGYDVESGVINVPVMYGRGLQKGDMDKIVVGMDTLRAFGYGDHPQDAVGKNIIFLMDGSMTPDWGPPPEQPPPGDNKEWWDAQSQKTREVKAEIVGVTSAGMDSRMSFITLDWAKRLQTQVRWETQSKQSGDFQQGGGGTNGNGNGTQSQDGTMNSGQYGPSYDTPVLVKDDMVARNGYGSIILKVDDTQNVASVGSAISKMGYGVTTAQDMVDQITKVFTAIGIICGAIGGIALFVAAIGIINTMIMATYERTREIGVMRACGATRAVIRRLFTFEAGMLGFFGGVIGLGLSFVLAQVGNYVANRVAEDQSLPISNVISFPLWLVTGILVFTTLVGLMSGLYPAHRAARLNPVEALRYE